MSAVSCRRASPLKFLSAFPSNFTSLVPAPTFTSERNNQRQVPKLRITHQVRSYIQPGNHGHKIAEMNAPDRFELFLLGDGEKKITEVPDTRTPNTSIFTINKEDHTLGNMVRAQLNKMPHVHFAGYKIPHPLFATLELRVQTDGDLSPKEALVAACKGLVGDLETLSREFTKEYELRKMVAGDGVDK